MREHGMSAEQAPSASSGGLGFVGSIKRKVPSKRYLRSFSRTIQDNAIRELSKSMKEPGSGAENSGSTALATLPVAVAAPSWRKPVTSFTIRVNEPEFVSFAKAINSEFGVK